MFTRILSSAAGGITMTAGLIFVMQHLVATGEEVASTPLTRVVIDWIYLDEETDVEVDKSTSLRPRPDVAPTPPQTHIVDAGETGGVGVQIPVPPTPTSADGLKLSSFNFSDGPLVNIFKVYPNYPRIAAQKNLEGSVVVQYDVTALGTVVNVVVIASTNSVFNKAAIAAAYRFKYKPRVVDGVPYGATGLRNSFRFEMEK